MPSLLRSVVVIGTMWMAFGCSSDAPALKRIGEPVPEPRLDGAAGSSSSDGDVEGNEPIPFCAALQVLRAKCQRCHQEPPQHGAPVPFMTYEDTQAPFDTDITFSEVMLQVVDEEIMPPQRLKLTPAVEPLTVAEKETLVGWLRQGARPQGGTDCD